MSCSLTLITGVTGLVGNNVCRLLLERGQAVRVLVRDGSDPRPIEGLDVQVVSGDLRNPESVSRAVEGATQVIHAAGHVQIGWSRLDLHQEINVEGTHNIAQAAREAGARLVHVSSCDTIGTTSTGEPADEETPHQLPVPIPYVVTKLRAEAAVGEQIESGLDGVIVNPGLMLGPWDWKPSSGRMLLAVGRGQGLFAPPGSTSLCDVRDVAEGILSAAQRGTRGERYILGGETITYLDAWRLFAEVTGARRPICRTGPLVSHLVGRFGDLWGKLNGREPDINSGALAIAGLNKHYSSARARTHLGYQNRPLRETVEEAWEWFGQRGYV